jgi:DNA-binding beta-propeller fold protein YncE
LSTDAQAVPGIARSFADVVSGPHAAAFTPDGAYLLLIAANSEDVLVVDASTRIESSIVRPLPGKMPDGIVLSASRVPTKRDPIVVVTAGAHAVLRHG